MTSPLESLKAARALLTDPAKWTRGAFARNEDGCSVPPGSDNAVAWCAEGALLRCTFYTKEAFGFLAMSGPERFGIPDYNDDLETHAELLAWFDRAILLAEKDQAP
jgi:hypothetical protein